MQFKFKPAHNQQHARSVRLEIKDADTEWVYCPCLYCGNDDYVGDESDVDYYEDDEDNDDVENDDDDGDDGDDANIVNYKQKHFNVERNTTSKLLEQKIENITMLWNGNVGITWKIALWNWKTSCLPCKEEGL